MSINDMGLQEQMRATTKSVIGANTAGHDCRCGGPCFTVNDGLATAAAQRATYERELGRALANPNYGLNDVAPGGGIDYRAAQSPREPRTFTRSEVLTALCTIAASKGGIAEAITAFENL
jgi:hypothetical protein